MLASAGEPLENDVRARMETRFGHDFGRVRVHRDQSSVESAESLNAKAYTVGRHIAFGRGRYDPSSAGGMHLLAHELTHTLGAPQDSSLAAATGFELSEPSHPAEREAERVAARVTGNTPAASAEAKQAPRGTSAATVFREPLFPDATCSAVRGSIEAAWPTAKEWSRHALRRLNNPADVASTLTYHFKIDPSSSAHAADLGIVRTNFERMIALFDEPIDNRCTEPTRQSRCFLGDGREYAAFVNAGIPANGITHCRPAADAGPLGREELIKILVHEVSHLADGASTDHAYRHGNRAAYERLTRQQAVRNADCYACLAQDLFMAGTSVPLQLPLGVGTLLSTGRARFVIRTGYDIRSRSGVEVFDLVGGLRFFLSLDPAASGGEPVVRDIGAQVNIGFLSRSPQTNLFLDTRLGAFLSADLGAPPVSGNPTANLRSGLSVDTVIGWANRDFRAGINLNLLYDFLNGQHATIIGVEGAYQF